MAKPKVSQEEYNRVIRTIESNSCYKFSAGDDHSGAFLIPVINDVPVGNVFYCSWPKLNKLAETLQNKPA